MTSIPRRVLALFALCVLLGGCPGPDVPSDTPPTDPGSPPVTPSTDGDPSEEIDSLLPTLPGRYRTFEDEQVRSTLAETGEIGAELAHRNDLGIVITTSDTFVACYQQAGAISGRLYWDTEQLESFVAGGIAAQERVASPELLMSCTTQAILAAVKAWLFDQLFHNQDYEENPLKACGGTYTVTTPNDSYHVVYFGTTKRACDDFCANDNCASGIRDSADNYATPQSPPLDTPATFSTIDIPTVISINPTTTETATIIPTSPSTSPSTLVSISVDRGEGSTYHIGEGLTWCYQVSQPSDIRISDCPPGQACKVILQGADDGQGDCRNAIVIAPTGEETLRIEALIEGNVIAASEIRFNVEE